MLAATGFVAAGSYAEFSAWRISAAPETAASWEPWFWVLATVTFICFIFAIGSLVTGLRSLREYLLSRRMKDFEDR